MTKCMLVVLILAMFSSVSGNRFEVDCESGMAFVNYSDIQIPKSTGTRISFSEDIKADPFSFVRGRLTYSIGTSDALSVLIAPLRFTAQGSVDREIVFEGVSFAPDAPLEGIYKFNSYRLSYQHSWFLGQSLNIGVGLTAKIRDAMISITGSSTTSKKTDLGFVPLIKFNITWQFARGFRLVLDGDALAAPQGRAEDVTVALRGDLSDMVALKAGYRVLEGGSDIEEVYSFTWINYLYAGAIVRL